jgi:hypothetical protein
MLWEELDHLLKLGCAAKNQGGLTNPWYFEQHIYKVDQMSGRMVTGEDVPLLPSPDAGATPVQTISWDVVELKAFKPDMPFQQVSTVDGKQGYMATDKLRSLIDYRLLASRRNGKWSIVTLISGD